MPRDLLGPRWPSFIGELGRGSDQDLPEVWFHTIASSGRERSPHEVNMSDVKRGSKKKTATKAGPAALPVLQPMVAGADVGSTQHWVCGPARSDGEPNVRVFGTTTPQLHELADWLVKQDVTSVAMESTYIYWIPVVRAARVARRPGRSRQRPAASQRPGTQDRLQRLPVDPAPS